MLNYNNLNDVEFEYLCMDILSRKLEVKLQRFGPGKDGGIDLCDGQFPHQIIVQVKHYINTDVSGLVRSLEKEIDKVERLHPQKYYVCCSKQLTPETKNKIFLMFSKYMDTYDNIITLLEIDDFLQKEENKDILRKHFKLWIESTNILDNLLNNNIYIDCESLLSSIANEEKLFVKTTVFEKSITLLNKNNVLMLIGNPGVGKTITSKMLLLHYVAEGYRARYTTDVFDLTSLKRALSTERDIKEVILLDDCFGQAYFSMKDNQENELLALVKYVHMNPNKILIMNSRITIYREAEQRTNELINSFESKEYKVFVLDMEGVSILEKAKIFYNHLYFNNISSEYFSIIKEKKNYRKIIEHKNFNPRIVEYICNKNRLRSIPTNQYMKFIMDSLDNPQEVWKNEYERRLHQEDRLLVTTIYSLSNTAVSYDLVNKCYERRMKKVMNIDPTINHFSMSLQRLLEGFITIQDKKGERMIAIANPSINDFVRSYLDTNSQEKEQLVSDSICVRQIERLLSNVELQQYKKQMFENRSVLKYHFDNELKKAAYIVEYISKYKILDKYYQPYVERYVKELKNVTVYDGNTIYVLNVIEYLFEKEICEFYEIDKFICDIESMKTVLENLELPELVSYIESVNWLMHGEIRIRFVESMYELLKSAIEFFLCYVSAEYYDIDVAKVIEEHMYEDEDGGRIDGDAVVEAIEQIIEENARAEAEGMILSLPADVIKDRRFFDNIYIDVSYAETLVKNYLQDDVEEEVYAKQDVINEVDLIFDRTFEKNIN